jgi:hypothetical protein
MSGKVLSKVQNAHRKESAFSTADFDLDSLASVQVGRRVSLSFVCSQDTAVLVLAMSRPPWTRLLRSILSAPTRWPLLKSDPLEAWSGETATEGRKVPSSGGGSSTRGER